MYCNNLITAFILFYVSAINFKVNDKIALICKDQINESPIKLPCWEPFYNTPRYAAPPIVAVANKSVMRDIHLLATFWLV